MADPQIADGEVASSVLTKLNNILKGVFGSTNIATTGTIAGATLNTGQGANELYAMDQNVRTTDDVAFKDVVASGKIIGAKGVVGLGDIKGMLPTYVDTNGITISSGYCEANGKYYELTATTAQLETAVFNNGSFIYLYIDDSESVAPTPTFVFSATAPTWSDSLQGWYNGDDRMICPLYCSAANAIQSFNKNIISDKVVAILHSTFITLGSSMNPDGTWQTPDDFESSAKTPINAVAGYFTLAGIDADNICTINATSYEISQLNSTPNLYGGLYDIVATGRATCVGKIIFGASRNTRIMGADDDDNSLNFYIFGFDYSR